MCTVLSFFARGYSYRKGDNSKVSVGLCTFFGAIVHQKDRSTTYVNPKKKSFIFQGVWYHINDMIFYQSNSTFDQEHLLTISGLILDQYC